QEIIDKLQQLTRKVVNRLQNDLSVAKTIMIQVRYYDFTQITRSYTLERHSDNFYDIYAVVERLYDENQTDKPVRLLGVSVSNLMDAKDHIEQLSIYDLNKDLTKDEQVLKIIHSINDTYGQELIHKGSRRKNTDKKHEN
ncbi:MAG: hypothetical protein K9L26_03565, partial [Candidatus Izimaplasma sp.]|nr:hypothetical protein [Candidatus Izimaplasma bacterium]